MTGRYRVTAPYVTLKVRDDLSGVILRGFYVGALLPEGTDLDDLARHVRKGMVEKVDAAEAKAVEQQEAEADKAAEVDAGPDKAGEAAVKQAEADKAAADKAAAEEEKAAVKAGTPLIKAADSKPGSKTASAG